MPYATSKSQALSDAEKAGAIPPKPSCNIFGTLQISPPLSQSNSTVIMSNFPPGQSQGPYGQQDYSDYEDDYSDDEEPQIFMDLQTPSINPVQSIFNNSHQMSQTKNKIPSTFTNTPIYQPNNTTLSGFGMPASNWNFGPSSSSSQFSSSSVHSALKPNFSNDHQNIQNHYKTYYKPQNQAYTQSKCIFGQNLPLDAEKNKFVDHQANNPFSNKIENNQSLNKGNKTLCVDNIFTPNSLVYPLFGQNSQTQPKNYVNSSNAIIKSQNPNLGSSNIFIASPFSNYETKTTKVQQELSQTNPFKKMVPTPIQQTIKTQTNKPEEKQLKDTENSIKTVNILHSNMMQKVEPPNQVKSVQKYFASSVSQSSHFEQLTSKLNKSQSLKQFVAKSISSPNLIELQQNPTSQQTFFLPLVQQTQQSNKNESKETIKTEKKVIASISSEEMSEIQKLKLRVKELELVNQNYLKVIGDLSETVKNLSIGMVQKKKNESGKKMEQQNKQEMEEKDHKPFVKPKKVKNLFSSD